jgi:hypothetical protein
MVGSVVSVEPALYHIDRVGRHFSPSEDVGFNGKENIRHPTTKRVMVCSDSVVASNTDTFPSQDLSTQHTL